MPRLKFSALSDEQVEQLSESCTSVSDILRSCGMSVMAGNHVTVKKRLLSLGLWDSVAQKAKDTRRLKSRQRSRERAHTFEEIFCEHSPMQHGQVLRKMLLEKKLIEDRCVPCGVGPVWNNRPLVLQMDHINGVRDDNRVTNLRLVCPNCHTQTETYAGRLTYDERQSRITCTGRVGPKKRSCRECGGPATRQSKTGLCQRCNGVLRRKVLRPPLELLQIEIARTSYSAVGRKYGVTGNTVRKWVSSINGNATVSKTVE